MCRQCGTACTRVSKCDVNVNICTDRYGHSGWRAAPLAWSNVVCTAQCLLCARPDRSSRSYASLAALNGVEWLCPAPAPPTDSSEIRIAHFETPWIAQYEAMSAKAPSHHIRRAPWRASLVDANCHSLRGLVGAKHADVSLRALASVHVVWDSLSHFLHYLFLLSFNQLLASKVLLV